MTRASGQEHITVAEWSRAAETGHAHVIDGRTYLRKTADGTSEMVPVHVADIGSAAAEMIPGAADTNYLRRRPEPAAESQPSTTVAEKRDKQSHASALFSGLIGAVVGVVTMGGADGIMVGFMAGGMIGFAIEGIGFAFTGWSQRRRHTG